MYTMISNQAYHFVRSLLVIDPCTSAVRLMHIQGSMWLCCLLISVVNSHNILQKWIIKRVNKKKSAVKKKKTGGNTGSEYWGVVVMKRMKMCQRKPR